MSGYLLDTHIWLWGHTARERLGDDVRALIEEGTHDIYVSAATPWEIAIKYAIGKLPLPDEPGAYLPDRLRRSGTVVLPIDLPHSLRAGALPLHHRDPFDRVIIAQAQILDIPVITADPAFELYDVRTITV
ncbi:type II toxin-antitoxin system VapC family toxin [Nocardioides sp.]|uniref:type II toxin-antitoxin system VapC family toxin n=1 Tax=Nocardioides sp. TaxID=35761 RepID=UPI0039E329C0